MFRFAHPYAFLLLAPLAAAAWFVYRRRIRRGLLFAPLARVSVRMRLLASAARWISPALFLAGAALAVAALARPQTVFSRVHRQADAIAIEMVVDCSGSMKALDFSSRDAYRSRLDVVKDVFGDFVRRRPDDLIGLVTFGGYATTRVPLTLDHAALQQTLRAVEVPESIYQADGTVANAEELLTAIGDGLATACARIEKAEVKSKIAVLLSDGESNTGAVRPGDAAKAAKALGIRVYTIGVGSTGRAPIAVRINGRDVLQYAEVRLDEDLLRDVAKTTGGRYFNARDPDALGKAMEDINQLERTKIRREVFEQYNELFARLLVPALALALAAVCGNVFLARTVV